MQKRLFLKLKLTTLYFGNLFEHYDTALYSFLSPFFATIFFPSLDSLTALILTFGIAPLGMLARPVGSLFFGYIGDVHGRARALNLSLWGMAIVTTTIAFLPNAQSAGGYAVILLLMTRMLQNFFAGGENIGGAICFLESLESEKEKDLASSIYNTSTVVGILLASGLVTILYHCDCLERGWRWLYIGGAATAIFAGILRYCYPVSGNLPLPLERSFSHFIDRLRSFWQMRAIVFMIAVASGFSYATYSVAFSLMNGLVPLISDISKAEVTKINTALLLLDIILLPIFGMLAARYSRNRMMTLSAFSSVVLGAPLFFLLDGSSLITLIAVRAVFVFIGVWFSATFHSWAQSLVPKEYRYSIVSFSYSIGSQLLGGTTATISLWLYSQTGLVTSASWYWCLLALLTFLALYKTREIRIFTADMQENIPLA